MDVPNARSSHTEVTPRGGGVAIVIAFSTAIPVLIYSGQLDETFGAGLFLAGLIVAVTGFVDDHGHIPARWRLVAHFVSAGIVVWSLPQLPAFAFFGSSVELAWVAVPLAVLWLVWMLNLYNFMDGIDGIATVEVVTVSFSAGLLYMLSDNSEHVGPVLALGATALGFLVWNFPPARIFMGDAGSGFLGIVLGALALQVLAWAPELIWAWLILLSVFLVDATLTLLVRLLRGEKVYEAHRSHAYQFAARKLGRHLPVTVGVLVINIFWLLPWACAVALGGIAGPWAIIAAASPLCLLAIRFRAGQAE